MTASPAPERLHALDALRASALLLGVLLHAAMAYLPIPTGWAVRDASTNVLFSIFVLVVHSFRLEIFFLLAGFFGRLMHGRMGDAGFVRNRIQRILLPLVLGWFVVYPGLCFAWIWGMNPAGQPPTLTASFIVALGSVSKLFAPAHDLSLGHLWFLYYLALIYAGFLALRAALTLAPRAHAALTRAGDTVVRITFGGLRGLLLLVALTWPVLLLMKNPGVDTPDKDIIPHLAPLLLYGGCFTLGWSLHRQRHVLSGVAHAWQSHLAIACVTSLVTVLIAESAMKAPGLARTVFQLYYAGMMWGWALASLGLFLRFRQSESSVWRYLADASYWVYLIHLPIVAAAQVALSHAPGSCWWKFAAVSALAAILSLASYQLLVRPTPIGWLLNGRRYPFWGSRVAAAARAAS
jgi:peptidoglycan/LPS O-acetylase OafA/YrhL